MKCIASLIACLVSTSAATAQSLTVSYRDGNPLDSFTIANDGCPLVAARLSIDLRGSVAGVLIDTIRGGAGTRDPLPVLIQTGDITITPVEDGARQLLIDIQSIPKFGRAIITLDTDDTVSKSEGDRVEVAGSEISGATVRLTIDEQTTYAVFDESGDAVVRNLGCIALSS